jgi:tRNA dimethylallyltransferase
MNMPPIVIAGPTASGKSGVAIALAERIGGTVVNADSMQVYRDLRVLTARPDAEEDARVPHRLFGHVDGADAYSAARWADEAKAVLAEVPRPILVGGTGLYLRTLFDGIAPVPEIDPVIRNRVRSMLVGDAHRRLQQLDPAAARRLAPADTTRVARALEVVISTGHPLSVWQAERRGGIGHDGVVGVVLTPDRAVLGDRIAARADAMLDGGGLDEVAALLARGLDPALPVMRAIGVEALGDHLAGRTTQDATRERLVLETRQYAKRQETWFRNQAPRDWHRATDPDSALAHLLARC